MCLCLMYEVISIKTILNPNEGSTRGYLALLFLREGSSRMINLMARDVHLQVER